MSRHDPRMTLRQLADFIDEADALIADRSLLRRSGGKNVETLAKRLRLSHTAASQHVKILRSAGVVEAVLVDQDDPRLTHQRLSEKHLVVDEAGKLWLDFGKVKICLD